MKKIWLLSFSLAVGLFPMLSSAATIAGQQPSLWLKPQQETSTTCGVELWESWKSWVRNWHDCSWAGRNATHPWGTVTVEPQRYSTWGINFHPRVSFKDDGSNSVGSLDGPDGDYLSTFIVRKLSSLEGGHVPFQIISTHTTDNRYVKWSGNPFIYSKGYTTRPEYDVYRNAQVNGGENLLRTPWTHIYHGYGKNGGIENKKYRIGPKNYANYSSLMKNDDIYEVISFPKEDLNAEVEKKVASYLAIKYGIPLRHDYFAGDGRQIYDRSNYGNQVFGLGKDTSTSLDQRIAKALEDDDLIISTDDNFTKLNDQHTELSNNGGYLLLWNNAKTYTQTTTDGLEKSATEQYFTTRSQKVWKVQNTNFGKEKVNLQFKSAFTGLVGTDDKYVLLVSSDENKFSEFEMVKWTGEIIGWKLIFENVEFPVGTNYMTVAIRDLTAPNYVQFTTDGETIFSGKILLNALIDPSSLKDNDGGVWFSGFKVEIKKKDTEDVVFSTGLTTLDDITIPTATDFPDGDYNLSIVSVDKAGNKASPATKEITIDRTAPTIDNVSPDLEWVNDNARAAWTVPTATFDDNLKTLKGADWIITSVTEKPVSNQDFTVTYIVRDKAGNQTTLQKQIRINHKPETPSISVNIQDAGKENPKFTFNFRDDTYELKEATAKLYKENTNTEIATETFNLNGSGAERSREVVVDESNKGAYYRIELTVTDKGELSSEEKILFYPPTVNFNKSWPIYTQSPTLSDLKVLVRSPNPIKSLKYEGLWGEVVKTFDPDKDCSSSACEFTDITLPNPWAFDLKVIATDTIAEGTNSIRIIYDTSKPADPEFTSPHDEDLLQNSKSLSFEWKSIVDNGEAGLSGITYTLKKWEEILEAWIFSQGETWYTKNITDDGEYTLTLQSEDKAGNKSNEVTSKKIIVDTTAPNAIQNLTSSFDPDTAKLSFVWSGTTDNGVGLSGYSWILNKNGAEWKRGQLSSIELTQLNFENIAKANASYSLSLRAVDKVWNETAPVNNTYDVTLVELTFKPWEHLGWDITFISLFSGAKQEWFSLPSFTPDPWYKLKNPEREPAFNTSDRATENKTYTGQAEKDSTQRVSLAIHHQWWTGTESPLEVLKTTELRYIPLLSTRTGFSLTGWATSSGGTILPADTKFTEDTELFALWEKDPSQWIELQFETQWGTAISPSSDSFLIGTQASELPKSQKSWFTFGGWNFTGQDILADNASLTISGTLYANWTEDPTQRIELTFDSDWGTSLSGQKVLKNAEILSGDLPTTAKSGYFFSGWSLDGISILNYPISFDQEQTLSAIWEKDPSQWLTINFDVKGGAPLPAWEAIIGAQVSSLGLPTPTKSGYLFGGWSLSDGGTVLAGTEVLSANPTTLYALRIQDNGQRITINFDSKGGSAIANQHLINGTTVANANLPTPDYYGYTFGGWSWTDGGVVLQDTDTLTQSGTLYALWTQDLSQWLSISYDLQWWNLSTANPNSLLSWTLISTLAQPTKNGFDFVGWNFTRQAILADNASLTTSGTLYANRSENPLERLTITYHLNDGSAQQQTGKLLKDGATFQALNPEPTRTGHTFNWWTKDSVGQEPIAVGEALTGDLHVYAQWKPIPSAVPTYGYSGGGGAVSRATSQSSSQETIKNPDLLKGEQEQQTAYDRAYENKITTLYPQQEARLFEPITRAELAKMMSVYATKFLEKVPLTGKVGCADFQDNNQTSPELANFMKTACELEIMGLHSDGKTPLPEFRPNDLVSRAEFATVLSRMKRGNLYDNNQQEWRWDNHLKNLNEKAIITVPDPRITELRGWILLMLHRMEG